MTTKPLRLPERLRELPMVVYKDLYRNALEIGVSRMTVVNVFNGKSQNLQVLVAIANYLHCDVKDVFNPDYRFQDPRQNEQYQQQIAKELGLAKG